MNAETMIRVQKMIEEGLRQPLAKLPVVQRDTVIAMLVGAAISYQTQLPATQMSSIEAYYMQNVQNAHTTLISKINECMAFTPVIAMETAKNVYMFRYELLHDPRKFMELVGIISASTSNVVPDAGRDLAMYLQNPQLLTCAHNAVVACLEC